MLNFCLYKPYAMCLIGLHFQPCAGSEPDCNCCLSNKYTYMQLRSPEVTRVNFHLSHTHTRTHTHMQLHMVTVRTTQMYTFIRLQHLFAVRHTHTHMRAITNSHCQKDILYPCMSKHECKCIHKQEGRGKIGRESCRERV